MKQVKKKIIRGLKPKANLRLDRKEGKKRRGTISPLPETQTSENNRQWDRGIKCKTN